MKNTATAFEELYKTVIRLRAPDGCPWDREQSPTTLRGSLIEEAYECVEAINEADSDHIKEEVGDVFLLATMIAYMHEQSGEFSVSDSLKGIREKLVRRHPHVFGESEAATSAAVLEQWDRIKVEQEGRQAKDSVLDSVSRSLPPLERAYKLQKKASKVGFDWPTADEVWAKINEELAEAKAAYDDHLVDNSEKKRRALEGELGDLLFAVVNICRYLHIDPAVALHDTNTRFISRFKHVEKRMRESGEVMELGKIELMESLWTEAKRQEG